jgi:hypothetical protein
MNWTKWNDAWPGWQDTGKRVEIEHDDGSTASGKLEVDDFFSDGEGEEIPVFIIIADDGTKHSFADNDRWRFT